MKPHLTDILNILLPREKRKFLIVTACNVLTSVLDIASLALLLLIVDRYINGGHSAKLHLLPIGATTKDTVSLMGGFLFFFLLKNVFAYLVHQAQYRFVYQVASRISRMNMLRYLEGDLAGHTGIDSAVWIKQISQQPVEFSHYVLAGVQQIITETVLIGLSVMAILLFKATVFLLLLAVLVPAVLLLSFFIRARLRKTRQLVKTRGEKSLQHLKEALDGYVESNLYRKNDFFAERYGSFQQELNTQLSQLQSIQGAPSRMMEVFAVAGLFILVLIHSYYEGRQEIDILTIGAFMGAAYKIIPGIVKLLNTSSQIRTYAFTIQALLPANNRKENNTATPGAGKIISIGFSSVSFGYGDKRIIDGISFTINKGECVGVSGDSGKGKTTLVNLLLGFLLPGTGTIRINGTDTTDVQRKQYWPQIAYVKQQPFIIHDSILANITMEEQGYDEQRLQEAILCAGLDELVNSFPEGVHKIIGEHGRTISGGQRQRIAIARAFYKNADLLILDEPFSELDRESELRLLKHLQQMANSGKMILLITHNQDSLHFCTKVISLHEQE